MAIAVCVVVTGTPNIGFRSGNHANEVLLARLSESRCKHWKIIPPLKGPDARRLAIVVVPD
jgi:hypothetical protein